ncbi:MAG: hypothetical protein C4K60_00855 [Ideonella sp. MAG2]|nr:MAG: hypothetical protein C4K60_00855 [Ideonella sp. MAG2]
MPPQPHHPVDLLPHHLQEVLQILARHVPNIEVRAFGSRVKGTAKPYSDLDLALMTTQPLPLAQEAALKEAFDEASLPFKVDVLDWASTAPAFRQLIAQDGVCLRAASAP